MKLPFVFFRLCLFFLGFGLISSNVYADNVVESSLINTNYPHARLIIGGRNLARKAELINARVSPIGNYKRGQVSVQNLTDERIGLEYKVDWIDDDGFIIGDGGIWERFMLGARDIRSFKSMGKSKKASKMQFTLRFPRDSVNDPRNNKAFE